MCKNIIFFAIFSFVFHNVLSASTLCSKMDIKLILGGCDHLRGLNVTTVGGTTIDDHNCDVLLPKQVFLEEPCYQYEIADSKKFYTLIVVDLDAPPQIEGEAYLHLLKANIPGLALSDLELNKNIGIDFRGYKAPAPSRGSGPHRYLNVLYEQADGNNFLPNLPQSRNRFNIGGWVRGKNLCGPVAATQFRVQF